MIRLIRRSLAVLVAMVLCYAALMAQYARICTAQQYQTAAAGQGSYTVKTGRSYGKIYDRFGQPLVDTEPHYLAVVNPTADAIAKLTGHALDMQAVYDAIPRKKPFSCEVDVPVLDSPDITVFTLPKRLATDPLAQHLIGYTHNGEGVCGLEAAYSEFLHTCQSESRVEFSVDGQGRVLEGVAKRVTRGEMVTSGVVTTLDANIQRICQEAARSLESGAIVVLNVQTGDILAMVSVPVYDVEHLADALTDPAAPFVNRALSAYGVGSVFKLVTAAAALNRGFTPQFMVCCDGSVEVSGQVFRCHTRSGHDWQNMTDAMVHSCNPYFISLANLVSTPLLLQTAQKLGFGTGSELASGIYAAAGNVPTAEDLALPAEKANFAFGQGLLTATPLQVAAMTAAIANGGTLYTPRLVQGVTVDGKALSEEAALSGATALSAPVAAQLRAMMTATVQDNPESQARPSNTTAAGKTSTAQTGQYDENDVEICHAWMTGFFPVESPRYAVTVFAENGGSGNTVAAPVFREIAEEIAEKFLQSN